MLEQNRVAATVFVRNGGDWVGHVITGETVLALPELEVELPIIERYARVELAAQEIDE